MTKERLSIKITFLLLMLSVFSIAQEHDVTEESVHGTPVEKTEKKEQKEFIDHHLKDSYDFTFFSFTNDEGEVVHVGFPLPVILFDNEDGLKIFMSSKFHHGDSVAEVGGSYYKLHHSKIYKTDEVGTIMYDEHHHPLNYKPIDFSITKNVAMILFVSLLMFWIFTGIAKSYKENGGIPKGVGRFFEPIVLYIRDEIAIPNIGEKHYKKYMSHLLTVFFFVWFLNLFGLTPLGVNITGNITVTLALALVTFFITTFTANKNYWAHIFWMPGIPKLMRIVLAPIEVLGMFIKPFALMIRLYANMVAGHVVLMSLFGLIVLVKNWVGGSLTFGLAFGLSILELLVALLQAYIFTMLSSLYFGAAVVEHDDHDDH
jgi:F-type H+-transporting ATPase subunit a